MYIKQQSIPSQNWDSVFNEIEKQECLIDNFDYKETSKERKKDSKLDMKKKKKIEEHFIKQGENFNYVSIYI